MKITGTGFRSGATVTFDAEPARLATSRTRTRSTQPLRRMRQATVNVNVTNAERRKRDSHRGIQVCRAAVLQFQRHLDRLCARASGVCRQAGASSPIPTWTCSFTIREQRADRIHVRRFHDRPACAPARRQQRRLLIVGRRRHAVRPNRVSRPSRSERSIQRRAPAPRWDSHETVGGSSRCVRPPRVLERCAVAALALHVTAVSASAQSDSAIRGLVVAAADGSALDGCTVTLTSSSTGEVLLPSRLKPRGGSHSPSSGPVSTACRCLSDGFAAQQLTLAVEPREVRTVTVSLEVAGVAVSVEVPGARASTPGTHSPSSTTLTIARLEVMPVFQRTSPSPMRSSRRRRG